MKQTDSYGRQINYLRISVTDRCNLRCTYCMPAEGVPCMNHEDILRYEEIFRLARLTHEMGFTKFRITGGEPLVRKGLPGLISMMAQLEPKADLALTTNGTLLSRYVDEMKKAGLRRINISLDTLQAHKFEQISRFPMFHQVMEGIQSAVETGFDPVKINVVVVRGVNDDEILDFVEMTRDQPLHVRFIELMPFSRNSWRQENFISADEIRERVESRYTLIRKGRSDVRAPSVDYLVEGHRGQIGFIAPLSGKFCDMCNRLRLTADGHILPCLHSPAEIDIKTPIRSGASDSDLKAIFQRAMQAKPLGHKLCSDKSEAAARIMSKVGG